MHTLELTLWLTFNALPLPDGGAIAAARSAQWAAFDDVLRLLADGNSTQADARLDALEASCGGDRGCQAIAAFGRGRRDSAQGNHRSALEHYARAAALFHAEGDADDEATALNNLGITHDALGQRQKAVERLTEALALRRVARDVAGEAATLTSLGSVWEELGEPRKALEAYAQALPLRRAAKDLRGEAATLNNLGHVRDGLGERRQALELYAQALPIWRAIRDPVGEGTTLENVGLVWDAMGDKAKALAHYQKALALYHAAGEETGEGRSLNNLGSAYLDLGDTEKARAYYEQALPLRRAAGDIEGVAGTLTNLGQLLDATGEKAKALERYADALALFHALPSPRAEATVLNNIGKTWSNLGERKKALDAYGQALAMSRAVVDRLGEATTLNNIGRVWDEAGETQPALDHYSQALALFRALLDPAGEALVLNNLGRVWEELGERSKAIAYFEEALPLRRAVGDRVGEATTLNNLGKAWDGQGDTEKAIGCFERALPAVRAAGDRALEATTLSNLAWTVRRSSPERAVFHSKQVVNLLQSLRGDLRELPSRTQRAYGGTVSVAYRFLAELLVDEGRVFEVLDLLKEDELNRLLRRSRAVGRRVQLTSAERTADEAYQRLADELGHLEGRLATLEREPNSSDALRKALAATKRDVAAKAAAFRAFLSGLPAKLGPAEHEHQMVQSRELERIRAALRGQPAGAVGVFTIFGREKTTLLLVTPTQWVRREAPFEEAEVARRVSALTAAMSGREEVARVAAASAAVYEVLVAPLEEDLVKAKAVTILWSLDGPLRYVPTAALWNLKTRRWLVEDYATAVVSPAGLTSPSTGQRAEPRVLAAGVTQGFGGLRPLTAVKGELDAVVRDAESPAGALPGKRLLDGAFTKAAWLAELKGHWPIVHVASHYAFDPKEKGSFLLLGDGDRVTLEEVDEAKAPLFQGVELLTLSACETAAGGVPAREELSGAEVDGLALVARQAGARAVLATLWKVDDPATARLMGDFYRRLGAGNVTRVEALRQAQLAALGAGAQDGGVARGVEVLTPGGRPASASVAATHPYYWAPFILLGGGG